MTDSATAILTYTIAPAGTTVTMRKYEVNSNGSITKRYTEIELPITPSFSSTSSWFPSNSLFPSLPQGWLSTPLFTNINGDHRTWVSDNRITPYSAIVHLFVQLNVGDFSGDATGFMVSDRIMLSAAHNFCYYLNSEPLNVEAYPGHNAYYNVNKSTVNYTYRTDYPTAIYIPNEFCLSRNVDSDFAILVFDQSVGNSTGWFGMNTSNSPNNVTITGYPYSRTEWDENKPRGSMWTHSGPIYEIASILQKYSIDATPGQSGSPIYNSSYQASAIFVQNDQDYMPTRSIGRRITSDVVYLADYFKNNPTTSIAFSQSTYLVNNGATQVALQADLTDEYGNVINVQAQGIDVDFTLNESIVNKTGVFSTNDLLSGLNNVVATAYLANDTILETEAKIPYGAPGPTTIEFAPSAYSATIPVSGSITKAVAAQVVDQYGNTSPNCVVTYSLDQPYSGVSISSSTGVVTIQSSVEPGMVIIKAESATLPDAYSALSLSWAESIPTSVAFVQNSYSAIIPDSGSEIITVGAQVKDQYDRVMSWCSPTYSLLSAYSGVSVNSTTGAVTIQSSAAAGTVNIVASYGLLSCMAPLTFNMSNSAYTMVFYNNNNSEPCYYDDNEGSYYYYIDVNSTDTINLCAYVLDSEGEIVTWPELISVEYVSDSEVMNTTGEFTLEELGIHAWGWYPSVTYVTVTAILSDSTVLQGLARVEATAIQPRR
jgi:glutamyl endopeptidase